MQDDADEVASILDTRPSLLDHDGGEALRKAAIHGKGDAGRILLERGASTDTDDPRGHGVMHLAAMNGRLNMLSLLHDHGCPVDGVHAARRQTPLAAAAHIGSLEAVRWLADRGANVDARDGEGAAPIDEALDHQHYGIAAFLRERGARADAFHDCALGHDDAVAHALDAKPGLLNRASPVTRRTVIQTAQDHRRQTVVAMLRERDAQYDIFTAAYVGDLDRVHAELQENSETANGKDDEGTPLLHHAARSGQEDVVSALLAAGADPLSPDASGQNLLHVASGGGLNRGGGHVSTARIALEAGVDVNSTDGVGTTALHKAAWEAATDLVGFLLEQGADTDVVDQRGLRAIDLCWQPSQDRIYERLKQAAASS